MFHKAAPSALILGVALGGMAMPAQAIVTASSLLSGSGIDYLDGVAELSLTRSDGTFGCSGSLLAGGQYVLTAAHCVSGTSGTATTSSISLSFDGGSVTATSTSYEVISGWSGNLSAGNDLAVIKLSTPITSIVGYSLYSESALTDTVTIAGYGRTGTGTTGATGSFGSLYYGYNQFDADARTYASLSLSSSAIYLYDLDNGTRSGSIFGSTGVTGEAIIGSGDSGGGSFVYSNGQWYLVGVHSFIACMQSGCTPDSSFGDVAGDVAVFGQLAWLQTYVTAVPEPDAYALFMAGLGLMGAVARRRRGSRRH